MKKLNLLPLILAIALFMESLDISIITTSLPQIAASLNSEVLNLKLALSAYILALALFVPISGWLADRFTARKVFLISLLIFILGSILCALSFSLNFFILARFLQGIGGAMMMPISRLLILRSATPEERLNALNFLTIPASIGPLLGPPIGGFITHYYSWHWIFLINIPIGIIGIICSLKMLPKNEEIFYKKIDLKGFFLISFGLSNFIMGISLITYENISINLSLGLIALGIIFCIFYINNSYKINNPILNLKLFKEEIFRKTIIASSLFRLTIAATSFVMPLMLQIGFHLTPLQSGLITFIGAMGILTLKFNANFIYKKYGYRNTLIFGTFISIFFIAGCGFFTPQTPKIIILLFLFAGGFFRALCLAGANSLAFSNISKDEMSSASPLFTVLQQISLAVSIAIAASILEWQASFHNKLLLLSDFHLAFFIFAALSAIACLAFRHLPKITNIKNES